MRTRARTDRNHMAIVRALRQVGVKVLSLHRVGKGCPDLLAFKPYYGMRLLEVKTKNGELTADQEKFRAAGWLVHVVTTEAEALEVFGVIA